MHVTRPITALGRVAALIEAIVQLLQLVHATTTNVWFIIGMFSVVFEELYSAWLLRLRF